MSIWVSIAIAGAASILVGLVLNVVFRRLDPASVRDYRPCKGGWWEAKLNQCDQGLLRVPQQPINTYTNIAYLTGGLFVALMLVTPPTWAFAVTTLYLCVGSALYHATSTRWAGSLDVSGIYAVFSALTVYAAFALADVDAWIVTSGMLGGALLAAYFLRYQFRGNMQLKIGLFLGATYVLAIVNMALSGDWLYWPYFAGSLALFGTAYVIWNLDLKGAFPLERWGHGFWHVLTAAAISVLFYGVHLLR
jgi:predicted membrane channel-forming protein YqfA (hemolysin III family)